MTTCIATVYQSPTRNFSIIIASFPNQIYNQKFLEVKLYRVSIYVKINFTGEIFHEEKNFWFRFGHCFNWLGSC